LHLSMGGPSEVPGTSNTLHHPNPSLRQPIHLQVPVTLEVTGT